MESLLWNVWREDREEDKKNYRIKLDMSNKKQGEQMTMMASQVGIGDMARIVAIKMGASAGAFGRRMTQKIIVVGR